MSFSRTASMLLVLGGCWGPVPASSQTLVQYNTTMDAAAAVMSMLAYGDTLSDYTSASSGTSDSKCRDDLSAPTIQNKITQMFNTGPIDFTRTVTQGQDQLFAYIFSTANTVVVAFRGSCGPKIDASVWPVQVPGSRPVPQPIGGDPLQWFIPANHSPNWVMNGNGASYTLAKGFNNKAAHKGWARALSYNNDSFYLELAQWTRVALGKNTTKNLLITGHSMGGAMAHYWAYRFFDANDKWLPKATVEGGTRIVRTKVTTFGAPRGGYGACGSNAFSLEVAYRKLSGYKLSVENPDDSIPATTNVSGVCPRTMGDRETIDQSSFTVVVDGAHDVRNYMEYVIKKYMVGNAKSLRPDVKQTDPLGSSNYKIDLTFQK